VKYPFLRGAHDDGLGLLQSLLRSFPVAGAYRLLDLAHAGTHLAAPRLVHLRAPGDLAHSLFRGLRICHRF
jgi:hypothetical protein